MSDKQISFEEVNRHFDNVDLKSFQTGGKNHFTTEMVTKAPGDIIQKVCASYKTIRPFLAFAITLPIPIKWKEVIKTFMGFMDNLCP